MLQTADADMPAQAAIFGAPLKQTASESDNDEDLPQVIICAANSSAVLPA